MACTRRRRDGDSGAAAGVSGGRGDSVRADGDVVQPRDAGKVVGGGGAAHCRFCGAVLLGVSLESLDPAAAAEITGVTLRQVYRWKSGEARPAPKRLELLREAGLLT